MYLILKIILICKKHARPYPDYNSVIYSSQHLELIYTLERVQRHFKRLLGLNN